MQVTVHSIWLVPLLFRKERWKIFAPVTYFLGLHFQGHRIIIEYEHYIPKGSGYIIMELLVISENKLKVILSRADMDAYSITCDSIDYDNTETRKAFWCILDEAKHKTGFDAASDRVYVQVYPSKGGGCEMYVTKMSKRTSQAHEKQGDEADRRINIRKQSGYFEKSLCRFENAEDMIAACRTLCEMGFEADSSLYCSEDGAYFLRTERSGAEPPSLLRRGCSSDILSEFGTRLDYAFEGWVSERCICICSKDAVKKIASLCLGMPGSVTFEEIKAK